MPVKVLPTEIMSQRRSKAASGLQTMRVTRKGKSSSTSADDRVTAFNVNSVERLIEAYEERERALSRHLA